MDKMVGDSRYQRHTSLKTYSRRVNKSFSTTAVKNTSQGDSSHKNIPSDTDPRRVLGFVDNNQSHVSSPPKTQRRDYDSPLSTTSAISQRQALAEIHLNQLSASNSGPLLVQSQKRGQGAPQPISLIPQSPTLDIVPSKQVNKGSPGHSLEVLHASNSHTAAFLPPVSDKGIIYGVSSSSPPETRRNEQAFPTQLSLQVPDERSVSNSLTPHAENEHALPSKLSHPATSRSPILDSHTLHLDQASKKRRHHPDSALPESQKVNRSSIKSYFKPLPPSSSPPVTQSTNIFSDKVDAPSSSPYSPISGGESPKYRPPRKKTRRNLSFKPSLPLPVVMDHEEEFPTTLNEVVGNMDDDARVELAERFVDNEEPLVMQLSPSAVEVDDEARVQSAKHFQKCKRKLDREYNLRDPSPNPGLIANATSGSPSRIGNGGPAVPVPAFFLRQSRVMGETSHTEKGAVDVGSATRYQPAPHSKPIAKPVVFKQTQFISRGPTTIECKECTLMYNPTLPEEARFHTKFHKDHLRRSSKGLLSEPIWKEGRVDGIHRIYVSGRHAEKKERAWFEDALETSFNEGLAGWFEEKLWGETYIDAPSAAQSGGKGKGKAVEKPKLRVPQYKIYAYTINNKPVSIALAQHIKKAGAYYDGPMTHDEKGKLAIPHPTKVQQYVNLDRTFPVWVSIDRLWTDVDQRRKGYATQLLDYIRKDFIHGIKLQKQQVAYSMPTAEGAAFARRYFDSIFEVCPFVVGADEAKVVVENGVLVDRQAVSLELKRNMSSRSLFPVENL